MKNLFDPRRPMGRLFLCLLSLLVAIIAAHASGPQTTLVSDTVFRADGNPAAGTLVISWPAFATQAGEAVAAGTLTAKIGPGGAVSIPLVPNFGAEPAGTYYRVVYKLDDGSTSEENWSLPAAPSTTIAAIRSKLVPANVAMQTASRQYVDTAIANVGPGSGISPSPAASQTITQPTGTRFKVTGGKPSEFDDIVSKGPQVDVRFYGAVGDGVTDDGPAIQAAINANPGRVIHLPKLRAASTGGGAATNCDYFSAQSITLTGNGQMLRGDPNAVWSGGSCIKFAAGVPGVIIPSNCYGCGVEYLELPSHDAGAPSSAIGIHVLGGHAFLSHVTVDGFGSDCVNVDGAASNANTWRAEYLLLNNCGGRGWYAHGLDANAGVGIGIFARSNHGAADIEDAAAYHNVYLAPETEVGPAAVHYKDTGGGGAIWIGAYEEGAVPSTIKGMVLGGNMTVATGNPYPLLWNISNGNGIGIGSQTYLEVWNQADAGDGIYMRSGLTADADNELHFRNHSAVDKYGWRHPAAGGFGLYNYTQSPQNWMVHVSGDGNSQNLELDGATNGPVDIGVWRSTGGARFGDGAQHIKATIDATGKGTFNGGVTTPAQFASTVATGTAPLVVSSTTPVANLTLASESQVSGLGADLAATEKSVNKNQPNGYAGLDGSGKIAAEQLPAAASGDATSYKGNAEPSAAEFAKLHTATDAATVNELLKRDGSGDAKVRELTAQRVANPSDATADFTIVVIPDTQFEVSQQNGGTNAMFTAEMNWIAANKTQENIAAVIATGDLTDNHTATEFNFAGGASGLQAVEGADLPLAIAPGNHDMAFPGSDRPTMLANFNTQFPSSRFSGKSWHVGNYPSGSVENMAIKFDVGAAKYGVLSLGVCPGAAIQAWAQGILDANPDRKFIVSTHQFLTIYGYLGDGNESDHCADTFNGGDWQNPKDVWTNFVQKNDRQIMLTVNGHYIQSVSSYPVYGARTIGLGAHAFLVPMLFANYQKYANGGSGYMRLLKFRPAQGTIEVKTYSPHLSAYLTDSTNQFTLPLNRVAIDGSIASSGDLAVLQMLKLVAANARIDLGDNALRILTGDDTIQRGLAGLHLFSTGSLLVNGKGNGGVRFNYEEGTGGVSSCDGSGNGVCNWSVDSTGKVSKYQNVVTAGAGVPPILKTASVTAQTAAIPATNLYASAPAGSYRVCFAARTTTAGSGTTGTVSISWNDGAAKTFTSSTWALNATDITGQVNGCQVVHSNANQNITYSTSGTFGSSAYAFELSAELLQ